MARKSTKSATGTPRAPRAPVDVSQFEIQDNIPIPVSQRTRTSKWREFVLEMKPGSCVQVQSQSQAQAVVNALKSLGWKHTTRALVGGVIGIWRVK